VWGAGDGTVFVVGALGTVMRYDGSQWTTENVGPQSISDVYGFASNDVWAVGDAGMLFHYDGASWSVVAVPANAPALSANVSGNLYAVWGSAADDVFVVGQGGVILHFDGDGWQPMDSPVTVSLLNVWGSGPMNVYAVGEAGTLLRYGEDGTVPVLIRRFTAGDADGSVSLAWEVYADEHLDGYLVYREAVAMDAGAVLLTPRALDPRSRGWTDATALPGQRYRYTLVALGRESGRVVSAPAEITIRAAAARLEQNHPNPFNPATTIEWNVASAGRIALRVYGVDGRLVRTLVDGAVPAGRGGVVWDGRDDAGRAVASGVYFYRLRSGTGVFTRKMILAK
jgi:hypothetical protein